MNKYGHLEFQVVVDYGPQEIGRLLNEMGFKVQSGQRFKDGDPIEGLYLDCNIYLREVTDAHERPILRMVIPDKYNRLPEESERPHSLQMFATNFLYALGKNKNPS